jgi:iron complex transport system substrate-binding protein
LSFKHLSFKDNAVIVFSVLILAVFCAGLACARTVTDEMGRIVHVRRVPQRIVSLAPGITETLYALGLEDRIVGVTTFCDWPPKARLKGKVGGFTNPSIEKIVSLRPDLIIATADGNKKDTVEKLERLGLPVYVTKPSDTRGVLESIMRIGEITGRTKEADELADGLRKRMNRITARIRGKNRPRVFFQLGMDPMITAGRNTLIHEVIEKAGGINIAGHDTANYPRYSTEGIMAASPDIIVFAPMVNDQEFSIVKKFWGRFGKIPAVQNNRIYLIDADLINRASPRIFDAVERIALIFHPDIKCFQ